MNPDRNRELIDTKKQIIKIHILAAPGAIFLGLGLYGMFGANGNAFHPLLDDQTIVAALLLSGVAIEIWQFLALFPLLKKHGKLARGKSA